MREVQFLTFSDVMEIHDYQIRNFGGSGGLRDIDLLKSAIGMPESSFGGILLHPTVYEMAAAYLYHLVGNHPFIDGNKRVGAMAALIFLDINNIEFEAPPELFTRMVMEVACGKMLKADIAVFLKKYSRSAE